MQNLDLWITTGARGVELLKVVLPALLLLASQLVQIVPGIDAGIVTIVENQLQGVVADRFYFPDSELDLAYLQYFMPRTVAAHLCGGREYA